MTDSQQSRQAEYVRLTALPVWARTVGNCPVANQYPISVALQLKPLINLTFQPYLARRPGAGSELLKGRLRDHDEFASLTPMRLGSGTAR